MFTLASPSRLKQCKSFATYCLHARWQPINPSEDWLAGKSGTVRTSWRWQTVDSDEALKGVIVRSLAPSRWLTESLRPPGQGRDRRWLGITSPSPKFTNTIRNHTRGNVDDAHALSPAVRAESGEKSVTVEQNIQLDTGKLVSTDETRRNLSVAPPDFTTVMTECPLERYAGIPRMKEELVEELAPRHAQLSLRSKRVFDRLVVLLPSHLRSHPMSHVFPFQPALLYSICHVLSDQDDPSVLALVLSKLRDWRLLDPNYRYSPAGIYKLALGLAGTADGVSASSNSNPHQPSHARLRIKWVGPESPSEIKESESSMPTAPSPSSRSDALDVAQECAHTLLDLGGRRPEVGYKSCLAGRACTPDSEDTNSAVTSPRHRSGSGFRSSCSACRHLRLPGSSPPPIPGRRNASVPFSDVNRFGMNTNPSISASAPPPTLIPQYATPRKMKRTKLKSLKSVPCGAHVDENEPRVPKLMGSQQGVGIFFPLERAHSPRKSNTFSSRDPFFPIAASVQHRLEPNQARQGDKHAVGHRVASVDPGLSMAHPCLSRASPNDLHPHTPTHTSSLSHPPENSHRVGGVRVGTLIPKLSSNAAASRSSKRLPEVPSWSHTHLVRPRATTTTSATPPKSAPAKAHLGNPHARLSGARSLLSSTSIPPRVPSGMNMQRRDRRAVSSRTPKHTSNDGVLRYSMAPTLSHARRWQV